MSDMLFSLVPVARALFQGVDWELDSSVRLQNLIMSQRVEILRLAEELSPKQLSWMLTHNVAEINEYFVKGGFPEVKLSDAGLDAIYLGSILKLIAEFIEVGETGYWIEEIQKPAFRWELATIYDCNSQLVVSAKTDLGFYLLIANDKLKIADEIDLYLHWKNLIACINQPTLLRGGGAKVVNSFSGVVVPGFNVPDMKIEIIKQLLGLCGDGYVVQEAILMARASLLPGKIQFEAAAAISAKRAMMKKKMAPKSTDWVLRGPMTFALMMPGHNAPLAVGRVGVGSMLDDLD